MAHRHNWEFYADIAECSICHEFRKGTMAVMVQLRDRIAELGPGFYPFSVHLMTQRLANEYRKKGLVDIIPYPYEINYLDATDNPTETLDGWM